MLNLRRLFIVLFFIARTAMGSSSVTLENFYQTYPDFHTQPLDQRIITASEAFLGIPYLLGALGEGPQGKFDQHPLYRSDAFDCVTYVETIIALAHAKDFSEFQEKMLDLRYRDGVADFTHRNHFTSVDWNPNNIQKGYLSDMTREFLGDHHEDLTLESSAIIDKPSWYEHFTSKDIYLVDPKPTGIREILAEELRAHSKLERAQKSVIRYLPLTALFDKHGRKRQKIFRQFPKVSVVEIVRPNWDLTKIIGTHLQISHMGFALQNEHDLMFRNASSLEHQVSDIPLSKYLKQYLKNSTVKGILVLTIH